MSFSDDINKWIKKTGQSVDNVITATCIDISSKVIMRTPVDTGRARGNWQASLNAPQTGALKSVDKTGSGALSKATATAQKASGNIFFLMNNLPYAQVLEYGRYPNPVKKGSYVAAKGKGKRRKAGHYEIRSEGGFSKQSPSGMVRITVQEFSAALSRAVATVVK